MNQTLNVIIITGGAGFIGRHLCKKLLEDEANQIICIDNLITGSLKNIKEFEKNKHFTFICHDITEPIDFPIIHEIYHLACIASPDKYKIHSIETLDTCFIGTKNILNLAKAHNAKLLFTSTSEIYGDPAVHPQPEEYFGNVNTMGERSCYDEGKRISETLIYEYRNKFNLNLKVVRLFNTYGPYMDIHDGRVITNFIKQIMNKDSLYIYGNGMQTRSFCYIDDMIIGLISMMKSNELGPINLGNPYCEITLNDLVKVFEQIVNYKLDLKHIEATENDPKQRKPDITKAQTLLGFSPTINYEDGIKKTIEYFYN